jgi:hypothetical protein
MTQFLVLLAILGAPPCKVETPNLIAKALPCVPCKPTIPVLFREKSFTCATLAEAVNHYVDLGEEAAIKELESLTPDWMSDDVVSATGDFSRKERVGWVLRILFEPRGKDPLRPPMYGALSLPWHSMPMTTWPLLPVAASGMCYFVLGQVSFLAGCPENPLAYLRYCQTNGTFRTRRVPIPTRDQALKDLKHLRQSAAWRALKWSDDCPAASDWTWRYIKAQAEDMPTR